MKPDTTLTQVLILGAGHGGAMLAASLRQQKFSGAITLVGDEPTPPYHRPPLSKAWLKGEASAQDTALRPVSFYQDHNIKLRLGCPATRIDRDNKLLFLQDGSQLRYDVLVLATGARPRPLDIPGVKEGNVFMLRNAVDALALRASLSQQAPLAIIGGGYIGLEVAASARSLGCEVTVLEREPRLLARVASLPVSDYLATRHTREGVQLLVSASASAIETTAASQQSSRAASIVHTHQGHAVRAGTILIGIGALPNDELAQQAGLACGDGIIVDHENRTSDPAIFAIGDAAFHPLALYGQAFRLESVPNANDQARQVAALIAGQTPAAQEVPWFWSDQYDVKLQIAGLPCDSDRMHIVGDPDEGHFAVYHLRQDVVRAVEAVNAPAEFIKGKRLIAAQASLP